MNRPNSKLVALLGLVLATLLLIAPSAMAKTKLVDSWQNTEAKENDIQKVALIAVLPDSLVREAFEIDAVKKLTSSKRQVLAASTLPGLSGGIRGEIDTEKAVKVLKQSGIDGVIDEDRLGLDVIYVQAKRWEGSVGRPEIQKFAGALQRQRGRTHTLAIAHGGRARERHPARGLRVDGVAAPAAGG